MLQNKTLITGKQGNSVFLLLMGISEHNVRKECQNESYYKKKKKKAKMCSIYVLTTKNIASADASLFFHV